MSGSIVFITTSHIEAGALDKCKEAFLKSVEFLEANGPQLMAEVCIDEKELRAHTIQVHQNSESILAHWQLSDPYMRDVMQYLTTTRVEFYGQPNAAVMDGMRRLSSQGADITVTPKLVGFVRLHSPE
jgi:hypothetical protein